MTRVREVGGPFTQYDFLGRKVPRRRGVADWLLWIARLDPARVRRVPSTAIAQEGEDDAGEYSLIACPCGAHPVVRSSLEQCSGCERHYVRIELGSVYVTYGAIAPPPLPSAPPAQYRAGMAEGAADVRGLNRPPAGPVGDPDLCGEGSPVGLVEGTPAGPAGPAGTLDHPTARASEGGCDAVQ